VHRKDKMEIMILQQEMTKNKRRNSTQKKLVSNTEILELENWGKFVYKMQCKWGKICAAQRRNAVKYKQIV